MALVVQQCSDRHQRYAFKFVVKFNGWLCQGITFVGKRFWFFLILAVLAVPTQITPTFFILKAMSTTGYAYGWLNSYQGMIVLSIVNATFIFMMRQFFVNFPKELEEAAIPQTVFWATNCTPNVILVLQRLNLYLSVNKHYGFCRPINRRDSS